MALAHDMRGPHRTETPKIDGKGKTLSKSESDHHDILKRKQGDVSVAALCIGQGSIAKPSQVLGRPSGPVLVSALTDKDATSCATPVC